MLGFFPEPFPSEILYSVFSRVQDRLQVPHAATLARALYGYVRGLAVDMPTHLGDFLDRLPPGHQYAVDRLINYHTMFPYYARFLPPGRAKELRGGMIQLSGFRGGFSEGNALNFPRLPAYFRYCPECAVQDTDIYGEAYWHRDHQVPGVEVCWKHRVFLEDSKVMTTGNIPRFTSLGSTPYVTSAQPIVIGKRIDDLLLNVAEDVHWLLENPVTHWELSEIRKRYITLLKDRELSTNRVRWPELLTTVGDFYPVDFLDRVGCALSGKLNSLWLVRLLGTGVKFRSPIWHILLMRLLGRSAEQFFTETAASIDQQQLPFGAGPWPCLNPASDHYHTFCVNKHKLNSKKSKVVGTFTCDCGFVYRRRGPDKEATDQFRCDQVVAYGPKWEAALNAMWSDSSLSLTSIGKRLGRTRSGLWRIAFNLGLPAKETRVRDFAPSRTKRLLDPAWVEAFKRMWMDSQVSLGCMQRELHTSHHTLVKCAHELQLPLPKPRTGIVPHRSADSIPDIQSDRMSWLQLREQYPDASRSQLRKANYRLLKRTMQRDREWLEQHAPLPRKANARSKWPTLDAELKLKVWEVADKLRKADGRPKRVTIQAMARTLRIAGAVNNYPWRVPQTIAALNLAQESLEDISVRRLLWHKNELLHRGIQPTKFLLLKKITIPSSVRGSERLRKALEVAQGVSDGPMVNC